MKAFKLILSLTALLLISTAAPRADVSAGISIGDGGLKNFYLAVGDHYKVPEKEVLVVRERQVPDEELPVVFYLAARAKVAPSVVVELRLGGMTWMEITSYYGLTADIYYVDIPDVSGPPYGKAYGYRNRHRNEWGSLKLKDADIVNYVGLKFVCDHYGYSVPEVVKMRDEGQSFVAINEKIKQAKQGKSGKESDKGKDDKDNKGKGKDDSGNKGKGKGK